MILSASIKTDQIRSYLMNVETTKDGVEGLSMLFDLLSESATEFNITVFDNCGASSDNGWGLEKCGHGFLFQLICMTPMNGFETANGSIYSYKVGNDYELVDWPNAEFFQIPKCCFITKEQVERLMQALHESESPGETGGFQFHPDNWELVSAVV